MRSLTSDKLFYCLLILHPPFHNCHLKSDDLFDMMMMMVMMMMTDLDILNVMTDFSNDILMVMTDFAGEKPFQTERLPPPRQKDR